MLQTVLSSFFHSPETDKSRARSAVVDLTRDSDDDEPPPPPKRAKLTKAPVARASGSGTSTVSVKTASAKPRATKASTATPAAGVKRRTAQMFSSDDDNDDDDAPRASKAAKTAVKKTATTSKTTNGTRKAAAHDMTPDDASHAADVASDMEVEVSDTDLSKFQHFAAYGKGRRAGATNDVGPSGKTFTPLEKQVMQLQAQHPGILLLFEVGYKYRFYGEDARIAAKALGHVCFRLRNFLTASFPGRMHLPGNLYSHVLAVHKREVHVKKLLSLGHKVQTPARDGAGADRSKVGIIGQAETAALKKASANRNGLFERKLLHLYTSATYIDDLDSRDPLEENTQRTVPSVLCLVEQPRGKPEEERVAIGLISVTPSTGDVVYDEFEDTYMRSELETRMAYIRPWELLLPEKGLSKLTEDILKQLDRYTSNGHLRVERSHGAQDYTQDFEYICKAVRKKGPSNPSTASDSATASLVELPRLVVVALAQSVKYLKQFGVEDMLLQPNLFSKFSNRMHMLLNANTLSNLEIFRNQTTFLKKGSLYGLLDHTFTKPGSRLLRTWIGRPLVNMEALQERIDAVEEILEQMSPELDQLRELLKFFSKGQEFPDLARGLSKIQYGRCTPHEVARMLSALNKLATSFGPYDDDAGPGQRSRLLNDILGSLPTLREPVKKHLQGFNLEKARANEKAALWLDEERYPDVTARNFAILVTHSELQDELRAVRKILRRPALQWKETNNGDEYLVEIENSNTRLAPASWEVMSRTTKFTRYRTPVVKQKLIELEQHRENLEREADERDFQRKIAQDSALIRHVANNIAIADCLFSLAQTATRAEYAKPTFVDDNVLEIVDGRHPMIEDLRDDPFVRNSVTLGGGQTTSKIITGPNMGGKSSYVRMVGLLVVMAQIGCYVPADSAKLGLHDALLARMGASDEIMKGRSTFMVEMSETAEIIKLATPRSLVILDELGRGTSTFDGMAIASAVLDHLVAQVRCKTMFITHYPLVATSLVRKYSGDIDNVHMAYIESEGNDGISTITFLYKVERGLATRSFGVECGRLAGLPDTVLQLAADKSALLKEQVEQRVAKNRLYKAASVLKRLASAPPPDASDLLESLRALTRS